MSTITIYVPKRLLRYYKKKFPKWLRSILHWLLLIILALIIDASLIVFLSALTAQNLINWNTFISFGMIEMLAAVIAKLFRIGGPSISEEKNQKIALANSKARFSHLKVVFLDNEGHDSDYPDSHYRVVNTRAKICYWVPSYLELLVEEEEIIDEIKLKDKSKWKDYLKEKGIRDANDFPSNATELGIWESEANHEKEEALYRDYLV